MVKRSPKSCKKLLVLRDGRWHVLDTRKTTPPKKGEWIRVRGRRQVYEVQEDAKLKRDGSISVHSHLFGMLKD